MNPKCKGCGNLWAGEGAYCDHPACQKLKAYAALIRRIQSLKKQLEELEERVADLEGNMPEFEGKRIVEK